MNHMGMEMTRVDFKHESDWSELHLSDGTIGIIRTAKGKAN